MHDQPADRDDRGALMRRGRRDKPENLLWQLSIEAAASGGAILTQLATGAGVASAIAGGTVPPTVSVLVRGTREVIRRRHNRAEKQLNDAAELVGGLDLLEERVYSHDERVELLGRVLEAAARTTTLKNKFKALSRVLVDGLEDDADIDEAFILAAALTDVETPHVEVLRYINEQAIPPTEFRPDNGLEPRGWEADYLARALPELAEVLDGLIAVLTRHGLLIDVGRVNYPGTVGPAILTVSRLGRRVLFLLGEETDRSSCQRQDDD